MKIEELTNKKVSSCQITAVADYGPYGSPKRIILKDLAVGRMNCIELNSNKVPYQFGWISKFITSILDCFRNYPHVNYVKEMNSSVSKLKLFDPSESNEVINEDSQLTILFIIRFRDGSKLLVRLNSDFYVELNGKLGSVTRIDSSSEVGYIQMEPFDAMNFLSDLIFIPRMTQRQFPSLRDKIRNRDIHLPNLSENRIGIVEVMDLYLLNGVRTNTLAYEDPLDDHFNTVIVSSGINI